MLCHVLDAPPVLAYLLPVRVSTEMPSVRCQSRRALTSPSIGVGARDTVAVEWITRWPLAG